MLRDVLFRHSNNRQFIIAAAGALLGFLFLLSSAHYYISSRQLGGGKEALGANVLILQKKVSKFDALSLGSNTFSDQEILTIREKSFIKKAEPVINNSFGISLGMKEEGLPYFRTDIFVQAVHPELMDIQTDNWNWKQGDDFIPLVMPRDFMVMLNQFAASYGIPQVSEDLAMTFNFRIDISGNGIKENYKARVTGFSNQISAVLVPLEFIKYANEKCGDVEKQTISQIMVEVEDGAYGKLEAVIESMNLDIKKNDLILTKVKSILSAVLVVLFIISAVTIILSALLVIQYSQIIISKSDYEITTLLRLGYHPNELTNTFLRYYLRLFGWLFFISITSFLGIKYIIDGYLSEAGLPVERFITWQAILLLFVIVSGIVLLNYITVKRQFIRKISLTKHG